MTKHNIKIDSKIFVLFSELLKEHFHFRFGIKKLNFLRVLIKTLSVSLLITISKSQSSILIFKTFHLLQKAQQHSVI